MNLINKPLIRLLIASAALVALASCSSRDGVHDSGLEHSQSRGVTVNTSGGPAESLASGARLMLRDGWQVQTSSGQPEVHLKLARQQPPDWAARVTL